MESCVVWTVHDYFDGCIIGVANFENYCCIYERIFDERADDWSDNYFLTPINQIDFANIMCDWERWKMWLLEYDKGINQVTDWANGIDLEAIAANSQSYRKFVRHGAFVGDWQYCDNMNVTWSSSV